MTNAQFLDFVNKNALNDAKSFSEFLSDLFWKYHRQQDENSVFSEEEIVHIKERIKVSEEQFRNGETISEEDFFKKALSL